MEYKCQQCGAILQEDDIQPYADGLCHIILVHVCAGDPNACRAYCPEREACGPVIELEQNVLTTFNIESEKQQELEDFDAQRDLPF